MNEELQEEQDLLFMLEKKYKNDWYYFCYPDFDANNPDLYSLYETEFSNHWYNPAERLIKKGKLEAKYFTHSWDFNDFGKKITKSIKFISAIKLKENIKK